MAKVTNYTNTINNFKDRNLSNEKLDLNNLTAISPIDGRYADKTDRLRRYFSEFALIKYRVFVEVEWLKFLSTVPEIEEVPIFNQDEIAYLNNISENFLLEDAKEIKYIENKIQHDVKSVEYFIKNKLSEHETLKNIVEMVHFACTSEDINNVAYALMIKDSQKKVFLPKLLELNEQINQLSINYKDIPMLARTHGQDASPTTVGKELYYFHQRINKKIKLINNIDILAKFNGAVGNYNAHNVAYSDIDWQNLSGRFIESFGLTFNSCTIQIEPHDYMADIFMLIANLNTILLDFCRDIWNYISLDYFKQKIVANEVGSSTMPHKVNPICFENAEGNLGLANAIFQHLANKLPISRMQRDLSDSTALRNIGTGFSYSYLAYCYIQKGLYTLSVNNEKILSDLKNKWNLLAEPIQTIMRKYKIHNSYEKLKDLSRGENLDKHSISNFIYSLNIPDFEKQKLLNLTPDTYVGIASKIISSGENL